MMNFLDRFAAHKAIGQIQNGALFHYCLEPDCILDRAGTFQALSARAKICLSWED